MFHVKHSTDAADGSMVSREDQVNSIAQWLAERGRALAPEQNQRLLEYQRLLYQASGKTNLISFRDRENLPVRHILPSLNMGVPMSLLPNRRVLDFGSGAGIPGIPLKILFPMSSFVLVESRRKRANFLRDTIRRLGLQEIEVLNVRIEDVHQELANCMDLVVTRAAVDLTSLWRWVAPVLKVHGFAITTLGESRGYQSAAAVILRKKTEGLDQTNWFGVVR
ncbi:MAG: 16S rRNA (guanine(527)-N(7))-methyltransferase RsmG [Candidatus Latescibacteria bacterium]|nr:16S rRNA (guanine(527)-N(7))-methyltransferase RsmG [Candidatus Latescibacterota bacterium]